MAKYIFGIDLGTTYSCISYVDESARTVVVKNSEGDSTTPSVVYFESPSNVVVGKIAKENAVLDPQKTVSLVKSKMGRSDFAICYNDKNIRPEEVSAYILGKLAKDAGEFLNTEVKDVVITCPAYFGDPERKATRRAGEIAGLNVLEIINEPTAAALFYGCDKEQEEKTILVYDLGGGTFDVTVMRIHADGTIEVICSDGSRQLGGKDWDDEIMTYIESQFRSKTGFHGDFNENDQQELRLKAEETKRQLSVRSEIPVMVQAGGMREKVSLSRETFDDITRSLLQESLDKTDAAIEAAARKGYKIDEILLVGGSTRMPQVFRALSEKYGIEPRKAVDPDEAVARGAAIYALGAYEMKADEVRKKTASGELDPTVRTDKAVISRYQEKTVVSTDMIPGLHGRKMSEIVIIATTKSYAVEVQEDGSPVCYNMIFKNTRMEDGSVSASGEFYTLYENQLSVAINVFESDFTTRDYEVDEDFKLGTVTLELPGNQPASSPIQITLTLNKEGILDVTGRDVTTNNEVHATMQAVGGTVMSEEDVEAAKKAFEGIAVE